MSDVYLRVCDFLNTGKPDLQLAYLGKKTKHFEIILMSERLLNNNKVMSKCLASFVSYIKPKHVAGVQHAIVKQYY